jgi:uncharacterized protein (DUF1015 family)
VADVRPFRAVTYAHPLDAIDVTAKVAPPYDVVGPIQRADLISADATNIVAVELADGPLDPATPGNRYDTARDLWQTWLEDGTLVLDDEPAIWVLEQSFTHHCLPARRRAVFATVKLEPFSAGIVLPHERTLPKAKADRMAMIRATAANLSPVVGLYPDPHGHAAAALAAAQHGEPTLTATAEDVDARLWRITDPVIVDAFTSTLAEGPIYIADGHHRYETALAYRDERCLAAGADGPADAGYDHIMMALLSMDDPDLIVLPTHRVADAPGSFDGAEFLSQLSTRFDLTDVTPADMIDVLDDHAAGPAYVVRVRGDERLYLAVLKPGIDPTTEIHAPMSDAWKVLDVAVLQELVLDELLSIHPDRPETLERLKFVKGAECAIEETSEHDVVFVMNRTRLDQLRAVASAGETMPQKSTYFNPKVPSGLLMRSLD